MSARINHIPDFIEDLAVHGNPTDIAIAKLVWAQRNRYVKWPTDSLLFWPGLVRDNECKHDKCYTYPEHQLQLIRDAGIKKPDARNNGPAIMAYRIAGGKRPKRSDIAWGWTIHHIYDGRNPARGKTSILHAIQNPNHFTETAGLVALHPIADGLAAEVAYFAWLLRYEAFLLFDYDPDRVFHRTA